MGERNKYVPDFLAWMTVSYACLFIVHLLFMFFGLVKGVCRVVQIGMWVANLGVWETMDSLSLEFSSNQLLHCKSLVYLLSSSSFNGGGDGGFTLLH